MHSLGWITASTMLWDPNELSLIKLRHQAHLKYLTEFYKDKNIITWSFTVIKY